MDKYAGSKIAKTLYLKPRTNMKNYEVDFSKQYGNSKTRLLKLGSIIYFDVLKTPHLNYSRVG